MRQALRPGVVQGEIDAPPSKSHTHRAYVMAALSGNGLIRRPLDSDDTNATLEGLRGLGYLVTRQAEGVRVGGTQRPKGRPIDLGESGTSLRLLAAIAALTEPRVRFTGATRLGQRPMKPLLDALTDLGGGFEQGTGGFPLDVWGPTRGGSCTMAGNVSSQFLSALLMSTTQALNATEIRIDGPLTSRPYVDITLSVLRHHGAHVNQHEGTYEIPPVQRLRQRPYDTPGDYSSAAFLLAAAALTKGRLSVRHLEAKDPQGDRAIVDILQRYGAKAHVEPTQVTIQGGPLDGCDVDLGATPDLFPVLCSVAATAKGTSRLYGAPHLRAKESDRISAMHNVLNAFGIQSKPLTDGLEIQGGRPRGTTISSHNDHRVAMAGVVLALAAEGESHLDDPGVVAKSYPQFFNDLATVAPEVIA